MADDNPDSALYEEHEDYEIVELEGEELEEDQDEDNKIVASPTTDDSILVFRGHADSVYCVSLHPSQPWALSGDGNDAFVVWNLESGDTLVQSPEQAHSDTVIAAEFNFDGQYFATASMDAVVKIWKSDTGELVQTLEGPSDDLEWMCWHPRGNILACGGADTTVWIYEAVSGQCINVLAGHEDSVSCGSFTFDGKQIATSGADNLTKLWAPKTGKCVHTIPAEEWHEGPIVSQACSSSKPLVATGSMDATMRIANLQTNKCLHTVKFSDKDESVEDEEHQDVPSVESVAFAHGMNWVAGGSTNGKLIVFDLDDGSIRHTIQLEDSVTKLVWHPTESILIVACADAVVRVIDARSGEIVRLFSGHSGMILDVKAKFQAGQLYIVTAGDDKACRLFRS